MGKYRGAAHDVCNLNYWTPNFIPVIMHNLSGYHAHLFVKDLHVLGGKVVPGSLHLMYNIEVTGTTTSFINNSSKQLAKGFTVRVASEIAYDNTDEELYQTMRISGKARASE